VLFKLVGTIFFGSSFVVIIHLFLSLSTLYSSSVSLSLLPVLEPSISSVTGATDWEFLRPEPSHVGGNQDPTHKITLDDFDGEISVFQVRVEC